MRKKDKSIILLILAIMIGGGIFLHWSFPVGVVIGIAATVYVYQYQFLLVDYFECFFIKVPPEERRDW